MEKSVILEIFYGNLGHADTMKRCVKADRALTNAELIAKELSKTLNDKQKQLLLEYADALNGESTASSDHYYKEGFKLGMLLAFECFEDYLPPSKVLV